MEHYIARQLDMQVIYNTGFAERAAA